MPRHVDAPLRETVEQFRYCANTASKWCWHDDNGYLVTSKAVAEHALYDQLRDETDRTANLVQKGVGRALEAINGRVECDYIIPDDPEAIHGRFSKTRTTSSAWRTCSVEPMSGSFLRRFSTLLSLPRTDSELPEPSS